MAGPGQRRPDRAQKAGQDEKILQLLAVPRMTERKIAEITGIPKSTVHDRITAVLRAQTQKPAEEVIATRKIRQEDLYARAYSAMVRAEPGSQSAAMWWDRAQRAEIEVRKLEGLDPNTLEISLDTRSDEESLHVATAIEAVTVGVMAALGDAVDQGFKQRLKIYAFEQAAFELAKADGQDPGPAPEPPKPQLAIMPGPASGGTEPQRPKHAAPDGADAVLSALAALEEDFPEAFEEDGDGPEDDQEATA